MPIPLGILAVAGAGAAGGASSFDLLETTLISTNTASVTFSNLNTYSDYKHLQIRSTVRGGLAVSGRGEYRLRFNSDSTGPYAEHELFGSGSSVGSNGDGTVGAGFRRLGIVGSTSTANSYVAQVIDILDFSNSSKNTTVRIFNGLNVADVSRVQLASGLWVNTAAVTSITLDSDGWNFASGSRFSLYGVK